MEDDLKKILKSLLRSSPARLQAYQLNEDFKLYVGKNIPFEEYGYKNLLDFLHSLSDILVVRGKDLFSLVELKYPEEIIRRQKKRTNRKKNIKRNTANKCNEVEIPRTSIPSNNDSNYSSRAGMDINIHTNDSSNKLRMTNQIEGNIATKQRRVTILHKLQEKTTEIEKEKKEKQELRYPKTVITLEKKGEKFDVSPFKILQAGSDNSIHLEKMPVLKEGVKSGIFECMRNMTNISRRLNVIPSKKSAIPTDKLIDLGDEISKLTEQPILPKTSAGRNAIISILDEPVPTFIPQVPREFAKKKSDDLIDFDDPEESSVPQSRDKPPLKALPFMEVMRLLKTLEISTME